MLMYRQNRCVATCFYINIICFNFISKMGYLKVWTSPCSDTIRLIVFKVLMQNSLSLTHRAK